MKRQNKLAQASAILARLERLPTEERVRQVEIYLRAEKTPRTIISMRLHPFYVRAKARLMRQELPKRRRRK